MKLSKYSYQPFLIILFVLLVTAYIAPVRSETQPGENQSASTRDNGKGAILNTVPFVTLRNKTGSTEASDYFGGERSNLKAGYCDVSHTPLNALKPVAEKAPFYIPDEIVKLDSIRESIVEDFWQTMERSTNGPHPVLYTHGFYVSFERGCKRASLLQASLGLKHRFLLFSWPSDGSILNYTHDESDIYWSVDPLQGTLLEMIDRFGVGKINIAAHSLGARGAMLALVRLAQAGQDSKPLFNQVVLIAPDIDVGIFKQYLPVIKPLAQNITVYVSANDSPLALSRQVHGYPRLGEAGEHLNDLADIEIIDISDVPVRQPSGHVYHLYHNDVVNDLVQLLNENKPALQRSNLKQTNESQWRLQPLATD